MSQSDEHGCDRSSLERTDSAAAATLIAYEGLAGNDVVKGQTLRLGVHLRECGVDVDALLFERADRLFRGYRDLRSLQAADAGITFRTRLVPRLPGAIGVAAAGAMAGPLLRGGAGVMHCRGMKGVRVAAYCNRSRLDRPILADIRGAEPEEAQYLVERGLKHERLRGKTTPSALMCALDEVEREAIAASDAICCVSEALAEHLAAKYRLDRDRIEVVHCGADSRFAFDAQQRERVRRTLGVSDSLVLCYMGGLTAWHCPNSIASLVAAVSVAMRTPIALLILSRDRAGAESLFRSLATGVKCIYRNVEPHEVPGYLSASDLGLLVPDDSLGNSVAFPVKFSEYSCCGLPVLATPYASDPAAYIRSSAMGALVAHDTSGRWHVEWPDGESLRSAIRRIARVTLAQRALHAERSAPSMRFDHTAKRVARLYQSMMAERSAARDGAQRVVSRKGRESLD